MLVVWARESFVEDEDRKAKATQHSLEMEIKWFDDEQGGPLELG
jgi:hypothetical protein